MQGAAGLPAAALDVDLDYAYYWHRLNYAKYNNLLLSPYRGQHAILLSRISRHPHPHL